MKFATAISISVESNKGGVPIPPPPLSPPNYITLPVISGTPADGNVLTTTDGTWAGNPAPTFTYQWRANAIDIGGATNNTYTLDGNSGSTVTVMVTATNSEGSLSVESAGVVIA